MPSSEDRMRVGLIRFEIPPGHAVAILIPHKTLGWRARQRRTLSAVVKNIAGPLAVDLAI
ncbi:hypothetical protein [Microbispora bryophytorum]|uniref:Uncharacterized protein n=1 Tax=Microbispora bryophytorum subsp. camponoti TaxID=1677852 RepID=A0ABR8KTL6_9ACTN|nr:hypothetical protein [Microbispora camponoti]MBD3142102.1 hypothetical protein [Microbispora camponoti]